MIPILIDTETTGIGEADRLCQIAVKEYKYEHWVCSLYNPTVSINDEATRVHGITNSDVSTLETFKGSALWSWLRDELNNGRPMIAHNAEFDVRMLKKEDISPVCVIDTMRVIRWIDDGTIDSFSLQNLKKYYGIEIPGAKAHDAMGDVLVLEAIVEKLLDMIPIEQMIKVSSKPVLYKRMPFGKYRGTPMNTVPNEYIRWLLGLDNINGDLRYTLESMVSK